VLIATTSLLVGSVTAEDTVGSEWKVDLDRANAFLSQGKFSDAISLYDSVIRMFPSTVYLIF
jgi:hypothetical protein